MYPSSLPIHAFWRASLTVVLSSTFIIVTVYFFSSFVSESTVIVISVSLSFNSYLPVPEIEEAADYLGAHNSQDTQVLLLNTYEYFDIKESKATKPYE